MSAEFWTRLGLGFILGLRHALEPNHVKRVTTVASTSKNFGGSVRKIGMITGIVSMIFEVYYLYEIGIFSTI